MCLPPPQSLTSPEPSPGSAGTHMSLAPPVRAAHMPFVQGSKSLHCYPGSPLVLLSCPAGMPFPFALVILAPLFKAQQEMPLLLVVPGCPSPGAVAFTPVRPARLLLAGLVLDLHTQTVYGLRAETESPPGTYLISSCPGNEFSLPK